MIKFIKSLSISILCLGLIFLTIGAFFCFAYPKKHSQFVETYSKQYNLNSNLVYAIIRAESSFNSSSQSKSGAIGLMQIMPNTAQWIATELKENFETKNLYIPEINIKYGCFYLRYLLNKFDLELYVLCAYNAGETVVRGWINNKPFTIAYPETANYVKRVEKNKKIYTLINKLS